MKRGGFLQRYTPIKRKTAIRAVSDSDTSQTKIRIQELVRDIVMIRDEGCILRNVLGIAPCNGYRKDGQLVLQADHLITRANASTYADTRLIVCLCKGHHGWKKWNEREYNALVRTLLSPERVKLWDGCERDSWRPHRTGAYDWLMAEVALRQELANL
jgi:hypothetical protein